MSMGTGITVEDIEERDLIKEMFLPIGGKGVGDAGIESAAEDGHDPLLLIPLMIGPLPAVFKMGIVLAFIVGRIQVVDAGGKAGLHHVEILVGESQVDNDMGLEGIDEGCESRDIIGIHLSDLDVPVVFVSDFLAKDCTFS